MQNSIPATDITFLLSEMLLEMHLLIGKRFVGNTLLIRDKTEVTIEITIDNSKQTKQQKNTSSLLSIHRHFRPGLISS